MILAFTGHRPDKLGGYGPSVLQNKIRDLISLVISNSKATTVISGMALGVDQWAAEEAVKLGVPFIAAVPCEGQDSRWPQASQSHYHDLLAKAQKVVVVSPGPYAGWKMQKRNEWMVDQCDALVAVFDGSDGGTANCVAYAENKRVPIILIDPASA